MVNKIAENLKISNQILVNSLKNNKLSHAYLFEIQQNKDEVVFSFIKNIICPKKYEKNCNLCSICNRIDNKNYTEIKIIKPDGMYIKKEQLLNLQRDFSRKSLESDKLIYVIYDVDKMNPSAANTILKFLEEPENGIIAILLTNNINAVINTIVSRCQIINCKSTMYDVKNLFDKSKLDLTLKFINTLEKEKINYIARFETLWNNIVTDKSEIQSTFELIYLLYFSALQYKLNIKIASDNIEYIREILNFNSVQSIKKKLNLINNIIENLKFNVNFNMLMDKFIIEFDGVDKNENSNN